MIVGKKIKRASSLFIKSSYNISLIAPVAAVAALLAILLTVFQLENLVRDGASNLALSAKPKTAAVILKTPISSARYAELADVLTRLNPAVDIKTGVNSASLIISIAKIESQPEWVYVLSTLQSNQPGIIWDVQKICMKKCDAGQAAGAELKGYTQAIRL